MKNLIKNLFKKSLNKNNKNNNVNIINNWSKNKTQQHDLVGPADKISNIRNYKYYIPKDESKYEVEYRLAREKLQNWNHQYWTQQNLKYNFEKQKYIDRMKLNNKDELNSPDYHSKIMTKFYKKYLDDTFVTHYSYNSQWYSYNFQLLWPAFKASSYKLYAKLFK